MMDELRSKLKAGDWDASKIAERLGPTAWPAIEEADKAEDPDIRQVAVQCAAVLGGSHAAPILVAGLSDESEDVVLEAARQLSRAPFPGTEEAIAKSLESNLPEDILELLALAAGQGADLQAKDILRHYSSRSDELGLSAQMALAKLGDEAHTRYDILSRLIYVKDPSLAELVKPFLSDRAGAQIVGPERARRMRRVCDQALDTLVVLLQIQPSFATATDKVYSDSELEDFLRQVR
jgi:HEAT repeat protein